MKYIIDDLSALHHLLRKKRKEKKKREREEGEDVLSCSVLS